MDGLVLELSKLPRLKSLFPKMHFHGKSSSPDWDCRLREQVLYAKRGSEEPLMLWEVIREKEEAGDHAASEWMYRPLTKISG